jgi:hypothetical protein
MLEATSAAVFAGAVDPGTPIGPINADDMRVLMRIETSASGSAQAGRRNSLAALAERDRARQDRPAHSRPSAMAAPDLFKLIDGLIDQLAA